jgi:hypothetical protein
LTSRQSRYLRLGLPADRLFWSVKPGALPPPRLSRRTRREPTLSRFCPVPQPCPASCPIKSTMAHRRLRKQIPRTVQLQCMCKKLPSLRHLLSMSCL